MYDLIIAGGGPAGATLARLIGKKYKVLLLDRRKFSEESETGFEKCCGGLLAPDAQHMLAKFGLGVPSSVLSGPQLFAVRTIDIDNSMERYYQRNYINIEREKFDRWLISLVPQGVDIGEGCLANGYEEIDKEIEVSFFYNGKQFKEKTKVFIGADGAHSKVRKLINGSLTKEHMYISIQEWFENNNSETFYGAVFDSEITDFYSWTIPKGDKLILGSAIRLGDDVHQKFELLKQKLKKYGFEFDNPVKRCGAHIFRPKSTRDIFIGKGNTALVGEAAGFISPSSAEGLSYAFKSALALSEALEYGIDGLLPRYKNLCRSLKYNIISKNIKSVAMYKPTVRNTIMKLGVQSLQIYNA